jgi:dolichol-phosphate mannosyltransferase
MADPSQPAERAARARPPRVVCTLPTYNEAGNIVRLARELLALGPEYEVLVMDDDSPDGTWRLVQEELRTEPRLHLLHRRTDRGRGRAGRDGFVEALRMGAEIVVEMDADFSHQPRFVPALVAELGGPADVGLVLGSRGVEGGRDAERTPWRRLLTVCANAYIRVVLGIRVRDCNSGFRAWRRETLERIRVGETFSQGPAIVQELLFKTARAGIRIVELPIEFTQRAAGESTLTLRALLQGYLTVLELRWMALRGKL